MNVILLDNDLYFLKSMELILRGRGHTVIPFSDPIEALNIIPSVHWHETKLPICLVDYLMPKMNGIDFFRKTKSLDLRRFGMISGHFEKLNEELIGDESDSIQLFTKPIDLEKIFEFIEKEVA